MLPLPTIQTDPLIPLTQIDNKKLAKLTGYTEGSAGVTMGKIKRKLKMAAGETVGTTTTTTPNTPRKPTAPKNPKTPKTPKSGKRGAPSSAGDESPTKKSKSAKKSIPEDDDEEFNTRVRVKKEEAHGLLEGAQDYFSTANIFDEGYEGFQEDGQT